MSRQICPDDHKHGETTTCYLHHKCGCADCAQGNAERSYYRRHMVAAGREDVFDSVVDARGVRRRLQALAAIGWPVLAIARRLGVSTDQVHLWRNRDRVNFSTHERVAAVYDEISTLAPDETPSAARTRNEAARRGWARPIDWDDIDLDDEVQTGIPVDVDEVAVQLVVDEGTYVPLTREERHIAVTTLNGRRYNDQEIAQMLRVSDRTILRDREFLGLPAHPEPYEERFAA